MSLNSSSLAVTPSSSTSESRPLRYTSIFDCKEKTVNQEDIGYGSCRQVNEFEKLNRIGEGTYGIVYRARDTVSNEIVALKKVRIDEKQSSAAGISESALREITILKRVKHDNVVHLKEIAVSKDIKGMFLVMEYCEQDLATLLDHLQVPFMVAEVKCILIQLLTATACLQENFIIHRDLKVSNLLLTAGGILKVADFGLARIFGEENMRMTPRVVTLWYRCPELLLGSTTQTPGVDIWAIGCILGELLLHRPLLPGKTEIEQMDKIIQLLGTPTTKIWPAINELPALKSFDLKPQPFNNIKVVFENVSPTGCELLNLLFTYDPSKRLSAAVAAKHPYFTESPLPCDPSVMPSYPQIRNSRKRKSTNVSTVTVID
ncbi:hypothetical protein WR25_00184 [Diploscapter pachys]|uniref:cyclin-dependent kinase n=1 Tax=Diploscapter pachys TaxID=2018661 RepID=A0A2A2J472_9BILA|nr:hypothetical protein WR25_00184 [Diploscapter pachys]